MDSFSFKRKFMSEIVEIWFFKGKKMISFVKWLIGGFDCWDVNIVVFWCIVWIIVYYG